MITNILNWLKQLFCKHEWDEPEYPFNDFNQGTPMYRCKKCGDVKFGKR